ncbi:hypothetical protein [Vampirovibrio sp.]|uniref:hypothetical protein n=1 Tax=Vampirovibrio sp. TaxID=2717857 RepID=UPI0035943E9C
MLLNIPNKKVLWKAILAEAEDSLDPGLFFMLLDQCYIDSIDDGIVLIVAPTRNIQRLIEQKAMRALTQAILKNAKNPLSVKVTVGKKQLYQTKSRFQHLAKSPDVPYEEEVHNVHCLLGGDRGELEAELELAKLHGRYGDIMGIVDNHPMFKEASKPVDQGGWGIFPQLLTNACKDYGVAAVLNALEAAQKPKIQNPRTFFLKRLAAGDFGYRRAKGADTLGLDNPLYQKLERLSPS